MTSAALFFISLAILFFILRYRVHVHITWTPPASPVRQSRVKGRRAEAQVGTLKPTAMTRPALTRMAAGARMGNRPVTGSPNGAGGRLPESRPVPIDSVVWGDIASALENLGAPKHRAKAAAQHVARNWPDAGFDEQLRQAFREVAA